MKAVYLLRGESGLFVCGGVWDPRLPVERSAEQVERKRRRGQEKKILLVTSIRITSSQRLDLC